MDAAAIRAQYFRQQLEAGVRDIVEAQRVVADSRIYSRPEPEDHGSRSGRLLAALQSPDSTFRVLGNSVSVMVRVPVYMRFLDMRRRADMKIYNRQIWGILYAGTLQDVKYEYRDWLRDRFGGMLTAALNP